jgi:outer membrane protein OmpA-like peptidoglycan-associated protein
MSPGLALAILEDPTGSVRLPIHLNIDTASGDTGVSVAQLLTGALRQALMGIVTAPLKGLGFVVGGVLGSDGRLQMEAIAFKSGSSRWIDGQDDYIKAMARTLSARPLAGMRIVGRASEEETRRPERLAEKRAKAVYEALVEAGVEPAALEIAPVAVGETGVVCEVGPRPAAEAADEG